MEYKCQFIAIFNSSVECPYMDEYRECDEIDVNPGNSDAWCTSMIEASQDKDATIKELVEALADLDRAKVLPEWGQRILAKHKPHDVAAAGGIDLSWPGGK